MFLLGITQSDFNSAAVITLLVLILYFVSNVKGRIKEAYRDSSTYLNTRAKIKSLEYAPSGIITIDDEGLVVAWNQGATNMFGYSELEMMGKNLFLVIPERNRARHVEGLRNIKEAPKKSTMLGQTMDLSAMEKSGKEFPIRLTLWQWKDGINTFYTGIVRNITEEKKLEHKLDQLLEMYDKAEEIEDSGVWSWDVLNDVVYTSKGLDRIYGVDTDDKDSSFLIRRIYYEDRPIVEAKIKENFEKKLPHRLEYRIVAKDGKIIKVEVEAVPKLNHKGDLVSITGTMHKIS